MIFDTHAHYDDRRFDCDRDTLIASLPSKGIGLILNPGCDIETSRNAVLLAEKYPFVYAAAGFHPHEAKNASAGYLYEMEKLLDNVKCVAVGEVGFDYHYDFSPREDQKRVLYEMLSLARAKDMPVIFHDREAHADSLSAIRDFPGLRGVFHCFSGSRETVREILALGFHIGFTGVVTFTNAKKIAEAVASVPLDRLLIETDAPYMAPHPHRGERCDSGFLPLIISKIAEIKGVSSEIIESITCDNGKTLFGVML